MSKQTPTMPDSSKALPLSAGIQALSTGPLKLQMPNIATVKTKSKTTKLKEKVLEAGKKPVEEPEPPQEKEPPPMPGKWASEMDAAEKQALHSATQYTSDIKAQPTANFPPEPSGFSLVEQNIPKALLFAYSNLARKLLRGPKRAWHLLSLNADDAKAIIEWMKIDAACPTAVPVPVPSGTAREVLRLWVAAMVVQCEQAKRDLRGQFEAMLEDLDFEATLAAWAAATELEVKVAVRAAKQRLHRFAWNEFGYLPFADINLLHEAAPGESFTHAAMEKMAWRYRGRDLSGDSQFLAMADASQHEFMNVLFEVQAKDQAKKRGVGAQ